MCSLTTFSNSHLKSTNEQFFFDRRKCGNVYVSLDAKLLSLHCLFCKFDNEKLDIFLNHLRSEHLGLLCIDTLYLTTEKDEDLDVKEELLEEDGTQTENDAKPTMNTEPEPDPLMEPIVVVSNDKIESKHESLEEMDDDDTNDGDDGTNFDDEEAYKDEPNDEVDCDTESNLDESEVSLDGYDGKRPRVGHIYKLIGHLKNHPNLWNCQVKSRNTTKERQKGYESIAKKMQEEFPKLKIDSRYVLLKCCRLKQLYFNYNTQDKHQKNDHKFYEKLHFLKGHEPTKIMKSECSLCCKKVTNIVTHMEKCHPDRETTQNCKLCRKTLASERLLKIHLRMVHRHVECEYCAVVFETVKGLNKHIRKIHADKPQPATHPAKKKPTERTCEFCGRQFTQNQTLQTHRKAVHLQLRRYPCNECPKAFKDRGTLKSHISSTHLNVRNHVCDICSKAFFDRKTLRQHLRLHSDVMKYECKVCGNAFKQASALYSHMKTHQSQKFDYKVKF